jgi:hypothetical protein
MTQAEQIDGILRAHDDAVRRLAESRTERRAARRHIESAMHSLRAWASAHAAAAHAEDVAMNAALDATGAALMLARENRDA